MDRSEWELWEQCVLSGQVPESDVERELAEDAALKAWLLHREGVRRERRSEREIDRVERHLHEELARLRRAYEEAAAPILKRLSEINARKPPKPIFIDIPEAARLDLLDRMRARGLVDGDGDLVKNLKGP